MTQCDACGRPIGHADEREKLYQSDDLERDFYYFGSRECQEIFEDDHGVEPAVECDSCLQPIKKENVETVEMSPSGTVLEYQVHPQCKEEFVESRSSLKSGKGDSSE